MISEKLKIIFILLIIFYSQSLFPQETKYSVEFGGIYSHSSWENQSYNSSKEFLTPKFSFSIGGTMGIITEEDLLLSVGLKYRNIRLFEDYNYDGFGFGPSYKIGNSDFSIHSISFPVTIGYNFLGSKFPTLFTGFEFEFITSAFEKQNYYSYVCITCLATDGPPELNPKYYKGHEIDLIQTVNGYLNFFFGVSQSVNIFSKKFDVKLLYNFQTEPISLEYQFNYFKNLEIRNFEFIIAYYL